MPTPPPPPDLDGLVWLEDAGWCFRAEGRETWLALFGVLFGGVAFAAIAGLSSLAGGTAAWIGAGLGFLVGCGIGFAGLFAAQKPRIGCLSDQGFEIRSLTAQQPIEASFVVLRSTGDRVEVELQPSGHLVRAGRLGFGAPDWTWEGITWLGGALGEALGAKVLDERDRASLDARLLERRAELDARWEEQERRSRLAHPDLHAIAARSPPVEQTHERIMVPQAFAQGGDPLVMDLQGLEIRGRRYAWADIERVGTCFAAVYRRRNKRRVLDHVRGQVTIRVAGYHRTVALRQIGEPSWDAGQLLWIEAKIDELRQKHGGRSASGTRQDVPAALQDLARTAGQ